MIAMNVGLYVVYFQLNVSYFRSHFSTGQRILLNNFEKILSLLVSVDEH